MGALVSCLVSGLAFCCCTAACSLCGACLGSDKGSQVPREATYGRQQSVLLLVLSILVSFAFKYGLAAIMMGLSDDLFLKDDWVDGCDDTDESLEAICVSNNAVYRSSAAATLLFLCMTAVSTIIPSTTRWQRDLLIYMTLTAATIFLPNDPLFSEIYMNIARVGGLLYILFQQFILLDIAYNWNDSWVEKSNAAELELPGSGDDWLRSILAISMILLGGSLLGIVFMFIFFSGCGTNDAFITITLVCAILLLLVQLSGQEGSLLSSSVTISWSTYLCFLAVSNNPNGDCNARSVTAEIAGIIIGTLVTFLTLLWTGSSWTAEKILHHEDRTQEGSILAIGTRNEHTSDEETQGMTGTVTSNYGATDENNNKQPLSPRELASSWKLYLILTLTSCWFAMIMTNWGSLGAGGSTAHPNATMWMLISAQWLLVCLYLWTLVAPILFSDRDFS